jgi:hypothetical protein
MEPMTISEPIVVGFSRRSVSLRLTAISKRPGMEPSVRILAEVHIPRTAEMSIEDAKQHAYDLLLLHLDVA